MKCCSLIAALLLGIPHVINASPVIASDKNSQAAKVLNDSYENARNLNETERGYYLARLTRVATAISHDRTGEWCQEQYNTAANANLHISEWDRTSIRKNALMAWARVDAKAAMERLSILAALPAPPYPAPGEPAPEDLRADASMVVFPSYWRTFGLNGLPTIENVAIQMSNTGEYPYRPMLAIMEEIHRNQPEEIEGEVDKIFIAALNAYQQKKDVAFANEDSEFLAMLEGAQFVVPEVLFRQGINVFVQHLLDNLSNATPNFRGAVRTAKGIFQFDNKQKLLLFRAFPLVSKFEFDWAQKLRTAHPDILENAGDDIENIQQSIVEGYADQQQLEQLRLRTEERLAAEKINSLKKSNPWAALQIAEKLPANARIVSLANILPSMVQADPSSAHQMYSRQLQDIQTIEGDSKPNLTSRIAIAKGAFYIGDINAFSDFVIKSFDYGTELFGKAEGIGVFRPGYNELTDLVEFCTMHRAMWILDTIHQLRGRDPMLAAYLFIAAAKGISEQASSPADAHRPDLQSAKNKRLVKIKKNPIVSARN